MKKAFVNITNNRLIVLIYSILFLLLGIAGIKSVNKYVFISQTVLSISIGAIIIILILLVTFLLRNVKKIGRYNQLLIENDKMLSESKLLYKDLFDKSPLPKWLCDRRTLQFYEVNKAALNHYGYSREEFLNLTVFDLRPEEDHEKIKNFAQSNRTAASNSGLRRHIKKSGEIIWVEIMLNDIIYNDKEAILVVVNDVTEKLNSEAVIKNSEELYRSLFNNSPVFIWVTEIPTLKYLDVNETSIHHFGYSKEEFLSMTVFDLLTEEDRKIVKQRLQDGVLGHVGNDRHIKKNGEIVNVEIRVHTINYNGKNAALIIGVDITEILKAEEQLKQEEEFYRTIMENSSDIQIVTNEKREIVYASPSVYRNFGFQKDEIIGKTSNDFWHPDDTEATKEKIKELVSTPGKTIKIEVRLFDRNKNCRWCEARISNQLHNPSIQGYVSNYSEITNRKLAEEKIKNSEELYRSLFNRNPLPMFVADKKNLQYLEVNDMAVELYGYSREEFLKLSVFDVRPPDDHGYLQEVVNNGDLTDFKNNAVQHLKKNGERMTVDVALDTIHFKGEEAYLVIVTDITKKVELQQKLTEEKVNKQIEITRATIQGQEKERNELGKELHDNVNQVLAAAKIYLDSIKETPSKQNEFIEKGKELINSGINEIRNISKSLVPPSLGNITLMQALRDLAEFAKLSKKKIQLKTKGLDEQLLHKDLKISVYRIIQEQLNNIMKYAGASEICMFLHQTATELEVNIADNGKGFDTTKRRNGIGITNMINRATIFNGKVAIDSSPGNGCRVNAIFKLNGTDKNPRFPFYENAEDNHLKPISS